MLLTCVLRSCFSQKQHNITISLDTINITYWSSKCREVQSIHTHMYTPARACMLMRFFQVRGIGNGKPRGVSALLAVALSSGGGIATSDQLRSSCIAATAPVDAVKPTWPWPMPSSASPSMTEMTTSGLLMSSTKTLSCPGFALREKGGGMTQRSARRHDAQSRAETSHLHRHVPLAAPTLPSTGLGQCALTPTRCFADDWH